MGSQQGFADESERRGKPGLYVIALVLIDPRKLSTVRRTVRTLMLPGQKELHFVREKPQRQKLLADQISRMPVTARLYYAAVPTPKDAERSRQACLSTLTGDLLDLNIQRVIFDNRDDKRNRQDDQTIRTVLGKHPMETGLTYDHRPSEIEECLHVADGIAWCWRGRAGFRDRISGLITAEICCT